MGRRAPGALVAAVVLLVATFLGGDAGARGNEHSRDVHAWVKCKAKSGDSTCIKPDPPGRALGHTKHTGTPPGPANGDGQGHGWGRAHAPGQLKQKDKSPTAEDTEEPERGDDS